MLVAGVDRSGRGFNPRPARFGNGRAGARTPLAREVADIFISLARNKNSAMTVILSRFSCVIITGHDFGRLAQWESAAFTRRRSLVQSQQRPLPPTPFPIPRSPSRSPSAFDTLPTLPFRSVLSPQTPFRSDPGPRFPNGFRLSPERIHPEKIHTHSFRMTDRELLRRYWRLVAPYPGAFAAVVFCLVAAGLTEPLIPWMFSALLDAEGEKGKGPAVPAEWLPAAFVLVVLARGVFGYGRFYLAGWLEASAQADLRSQCGERMLRWPAGEFQKTSPGKIASSVMTFTVGLTRVASNLLVSAAQDCVKVLAYLALLFYLRWDLALAVLVASPFIALLIRRLSRRIRKRADEIRRGVELGADELLEAARLWPAIKTQGGEEAERARLSRRFSRLREVAIKVSRNDSAAQPLGQFLLALAFAYVVHQILAALSSGTMTPGDAAAFVSAMLLLQLPVRNLTRFFPRWAEARANAAAVFSFLETPTERDGGTTEVGRARGEIVFRDVVFRHPGAERPALDGASLTVRAGETVALVGRSGAGKSTLASLLPRFYDPQSGGILLDGRDLRELTLASLRKQIALVAQDPLIFNDTAAANVSYPESAGESGADSPESRGRGSERVGAALRDAAADFALEHPEKKAGAGGSALSGGQRQRLALARAFYKDAPIVILDEPTAALDAETEAKIKEALRRLLAGRTAIVITHRFSAIDFADRVAVLDAGKVVAEGTTAELLKSSPLFRELYEAQRLKEGG